MQYKRLDICFAKKWKTFTEVRDVKMKSTKSGQILSFFLMLLCTQVRSSFQSSALFKFSVSGHRLTDHVISECDALSVLECAQYCLRKPSLCKSINYKARQSQKSSKNCQLNNATKSSHPQKLRAESDYDIYEPLNLKKNQTEEQVKLGRKSCADWLNKTAVSLQDGVYIINPDGREDFEVWCDMTTDGGGWTVFQRRIDGSVNFSRDWLSYENGFGNKNNNYWLGLRKIHLLLESGEHTLRIDLEDCESNTAYAVYNVFSLGDQDGDYALTVGDYSGTAGDSLSYHNGNKFSTYDKENDFDDERNCAKIYHGGWWFRECLASNLNGLYLNGSHSGIAAAGIHWLGFKGGQYSLKRSEMKIRQKN